MGYYVKSKGYRIREDKKQEVIGLIEKTFRGSKYDTALDRVLKSKVMTWKRWMYYFDYNYLSDILEEVEENKEDTKIDDDREDIKYYDNIGI